MFAALFYIVIGWIVLSFAVGVYKYLSTPNPKSDLALNATVHMLKLPYATVKALYELYKK